MLAHPHSGEAGFTEEQLDPRHTLCADIKSMFRSVPGSVREDILAAFVSPAKLLHFVDLYGRYLLHHIPVLHKPSFQALRTPPVLHAAMIVAGACFADDHTLAEMVDEFAIGLLKVIQNQQVSLSIR